MSANGNVIREGKCISIDLLFWQQTNQYVCDSECEIINQTHKNYFYQSNILLKILLLQTGNTNLYSQLQFFLKKYSKIAK